tara:strand:- start:219198 stop:223676 length:4479 start_codon:yes stop_codon:yes gene_type:complete
MYTKHEIKRTTILISAVLPLTLAAGLAESANPTSTKDSRTSWIENIQGEKILVEGTTRALKQPSYGYSANRLFEQQWRSDFRKELNWAELSDENKQALWHKAVGPDQVDANGINLVNFAWSYTKSVRADDHIASDLILNYDGDIVVIGSDLGGNNADPGFSRIFVTELDGTANASDGWTENWERAVSYSTSGENGYVSAERGAVDFHGNTYTCGMRSNGKFNVWKFFGLTGSTLWSTNQELLNGTDAIATDIAIDPEGAVYVSGKYTSNSTGLPSWFVARLNGANGQVDWVKEPPVPGSPIGGIEFDRKGDLLIAGVAPGAHLVAKLRAVDGALQWTNTVSAGTPGLSFIDTLRLDPHGDVYFASRISNADSGWRITKWDGESGDQLWTESTSDGQVQNMEVDQDGNAYVCGSGDGRTYKLVKYDTDGNEIWVYTTGTTGIATSVALDRLGNPYMAGWFGGEGTGNLAKIMTTKHSPVDGSVVWEMIDSPDRPNEENNLITPKDLIVDAGGSVYIAGHRTGEDTQNGAIGKEFFVIKYEQPYVSIPQITRSYPQLSLEGRSVWDPDGSLGIDGFSYEEPLFTLKSSDVISRSDINDRLDATVDYGLGTIEGGVKLREFSGRVDVSIQAHVSAGVFDASTTGELAIAVPAETDIFAGQNFDIILNWDPDEFATDLITNIEPRLEGGVYANASMNIDADLHIKKGDGSDIINTDIFAGELDFAETFNEGNHLNVLGVDFLNLPPGGVWYDPVQFPYTRFFSGKVRSPILRSEGIFDEDDAVISSFIRQRFFEGKIRLTELLLAYFGQGPMSFNWSPAGGSGSWNADVDAGMIQADIDGRLYLLQDLYLQVRPYVRLEFDSDGDVTPDDVRINFYNDNAGGNNFGNPVEERTHTVRMPDNGELEISPVFGADLTLVNSSGIEIELEAGFDVARFEASASALGTDLINIDKCIGCTDVTTNRIIRLKDLGIDINESFCFPNEHHLAPMQVFGDTDLQPQLIGSSRETAPLLIYNQRTPTQSQFDDMASGISPMVLYGYKFFGGSGISVHIEHHGRSETLERTRLNEQALLIEVPNRFFLLPGTARIWITNDNGTSESIDLTIEYPFPNFQGLEETYWASDPRWAEEPIVLVDGGTPAGNDSFIARRDYFQHMQDSLWNPSILSDLGNPNMSAVEYFPTFSGWNRVGSEPSTPGFPSVVLDGVSLSRDQQAQSDGTLRVKVAEELVAMSGFKSIALINPGPGGGMSRISTLQVPAPRPVISEVSPNLFTPGEIETDSKGFVRLRVLGPNTVPFFDGYEAPKYGNFTPRSIVRIDGIPAETTFVSSGELVARVASGAFNSFGRRVVTVRTPNPMGTVFTEHLVDGNQNDYGEESIASGGVSDPYVIEMLWPTPEVDFVSHPVIEAGAPPYPAITIDGEPALDDHNITIQGSNFAPGSQVFVNGSLIPSTRDTSSIIRATLSANDVYMIGPIQIWVGNPPPSVRTSDPMIISVIAPSNP